ncbi:Auxin-binding protein [bacterium]|nr:Auxin-binding protein [bacterium]
MPLMMGNNPAPTDLNTMTNRLTDNSLYRVSFITIPNPIAINDMHSWILNLQTADGQAVDDAEIGVDGGMPQHGHGLPTRPQVTENLGNGDYLVEGLRFQMPGWWEVKFEITAAGQSDNITFNVVLP